MSSHSNGKAASGSQTPAVTEKKIEQIKAAAQNLAQQLDELNLNSAAGGELVSFKFVGQVNWPFAATVAVVTGGTTYIADALIRARYQVHVQSTTRTGAYQSVDMLLSPPSPTSNVQQDWNAAVNADVQKDGHINEGVKEESAVVYYRNHIANIKAVLSESFDNALADSGDA
ncbi:uncharacterized protein FPRO_08868 [Fusarium proliferatum ET1]|uniref:Uncharacterized protein n=2 Tax=Gibberella intermedia TaxID=948311 RepID=A0A1L7W9W5_FUSPR|nr:uncharacterized protein FPRO_08868 [Fusarium proliferatum ET1]RKL37997.1 hypothetical protein BFJ72_g7457 [Fusarium proliferatum]CZR49391.1 uncharacterized protein FPRO_08868 [Fusarium proliferatum ET1]